MSTRYFISSDLNELLGITPIHLNALVHRKLYGITASISDRHGETKLRIFGEEDVFGVALVWMLFEAGLRTQPIRGVLNQLVETKRPDANLAAEFLLDSEADYLVVVCELTKPKGKASPKAWADRAMEEDLAEIIAKNPTASVLVVPVGAQFADIKKRIEARYGE